MLGAGGGVFGPTGVSVEVWLTLGWLKGAPGRCETLGDAERPPSAAAAP